MTEFEADPATFGFEKVGSEVLDAFSTRDGMEMLMQWGLDGEKLSFHRFRFAGQLTGAKDDYDRILKDFLQNPHVLGHLSMSGTPTVPLNMQTKVLSTKAMSMNFFDRLTEARILSEGGSIRGCFNEVYDGISVDDLLRDLFVNPYSENIDLYTEEEKDELIFHLLKVFVIGGDMCQQDDKIERYLKCTKDLYKALLTVFKSEDDGSFQVAGRVVELLEVEGVDLWAHESARNKMILVIDPKKNVVTVMKNGPHKSFW